MILCAQEHLDDCAENREMAERNLYAAILAQALRDIIETETTLSSAKDREKSFNWIFRNERGKGEKVTFLDCMEALGFEPTAFRKGLNSLTLEQKRLLRNMK